MAVLELRAKRWELEAEWERLVFAHGKTDWPAVRLVIRRIKNIKREMERMK